MRKLTYQEINDITAYMSDYKWARNSCRKLEARNRLLKYIEDLIKEAGEVCEICGKSLGVESSFLRDTEDTLHRVCVDCGVAQKSALEEGDTPEPEMFHAGYWTWTVKP